MRETKGLGVYNVVIIGAGTAGLVTAAGTAGLGGRVALIERNKMGGDCLNYGCVPSKALIASARVINRIRHATKWGLVEEEPRFEFQTVFESMRSRRAKIAANDSMERFESLGVDVFLGEARFVSPHEIAVGDQTLRAKSFVIAAGTRARIPPIEGMCDVPFFTNETIFDELHKRPESMIVLGGGPIGCELSQAMGRLGVNATVIQVHEQLLPKEDPEVANWMEKLLEAEGVRVICSSRAVRASMRDGKVQLDLVHEPRGRHESHTMQIVADTLLVSAGRVPNVEKLNLDAAGVKFNSRGIKVNAYLQTSQPHIYAAGDVAGPYQFTHTADAQARVVVRNILMPFQMLRQKMDYSVVPWCTYTDPEIAHVGLNQAEARKHNIPYDLINLRIDELDRAVVEREELGFVNVLTAKGTDRILGVTMVAAHAGDLLHEFVLAMKHRIGLSQLATTIHAYPTFAELGRKVGDRYSKKRLTPFLKRAFTWLYQRSRTASGFNSPNVRAARNVSGKRDTLTRAVPWKWIGLGVLIIALLILLRVLPVTHWFTEFNRWIAHLGIWGVVLFMAVYVVATVLFFPASVLTVGAGIVFGVLSGTIIVSISATTGAAVAFLIARYLSRGKIERKVSNDQKFEQFDRAIGEQGAKLVFLLRLSPLIPFNVSNYFYGLTAVRFWPYVLASWIGTLPGTLLYVYLGAAGRAGLNAAAGQSSGRSPWEYVLFSLGLIATVVVTVWVTRIARRELSKSEVNPR